MDKKASNDIKERPREREREGEREEKENEERGEREEDIASEIEGFALNWVTMKTDRVCGGQGGTEGKWRSFG